MSVCECVCFLSHTLVECRSMFSLCFDTIVDRNFLCVQFLYRLIKTADWNVNTQTETLYQADLHDHHHFVSSDAVQHQVQVRVKCVTWMPSVYKTNMIIIKMHFKTQHTKPNRNTSLLSSNDCLRVFSRNCQSHRKQNEYKHRYTAMPSKRKTHFELLLSFSLGIEDLFVGLKTCTFVFM